MIDKRDLDKSKDYLINSTAEGIIIDERLIKRFIRIVTLTIAPTSRATVIELSFKKK